MSEMRNRCGLSEEWPAAEVIKAVKERVNRGEMGGQMVSKLYSYDFADNEDYQDIMRYAHI